METIACCICGQQETEPVRARIVPDEYAGLMPDAPARSSWVTCRRCGLVFQNPRPDAAQMLHLYEGGVYRNWDEVPQQFFDYAERRPQPVLGWLATRPEIQRLEEQLAPRALDIGCGVGGSLPLLRARGWDARGVEPDPQLARAGEAKYNAPILAGLMDENAYADVDFDLALSIHTFEHLLEPLEVARAAHARLVARSGLLCVVMPTYVRASHWAWEWMNTAHTYIFTGPTLGNLLFKAGFETLAYRYPSRRNHKFQEPSEVWILARALPTMPDANARLPFREPIARVRRQMMRVVPRAGAAWLDHRARRAAYFVRRRALKLAPADN